MDTLTFPEINIRKTDDDRYSVFDAIQFIAHKKNGRMVWKRLCESHPDIVTDVTISKCIGFKQKPTPVAGKKTIIEIILLLPGEIGGTTRKAASELLLKYIEAPDELAKQAIARITDSEKLRGVHEEATKKYLSKYHPLMGEIQKRDGQTPVTYQHVNTINTKVCMGAEPAIIKAERSGKTAREYATSEELGRLMVLQELQCCGLRKVDAKGHSEISNVVQSAANDFQAMLEQFGVV
ncbi:MAG: hypothetical protein ACRCT2_13905 [Plesiomonas shigelloides]